MSIRARGAPWGDSEAICGSLQLAHWSQAASLLGFSLFLCTPRIFFLAQSSQQSFPCIINIHVSTYFIKVVRILGAISGCVIFDFLAVGSEASNVTSSSLARQTIAPTVLLGWTGLKPVSLNSERRYCLSLFLIAIQLMLGTT